MRVVLVRPGGIDIEDFLTPDPLRGVG